MVNPPTRSHEGRVHFQVKAKYITLYINTLYYPRQHGFGVGQRAHTSSVGELSKIETGLTQTKGSLSAHHRRKHYKFIPAMSLVVGAWELSCAEA